MALIDTRMGKLKFDPSTDSVEKINLSDDAFSLALKEDMEHVQTGLKAGSINLSKVLYLSAENLKEMFAANGNATTEEGSVLIFYQTAITDEITNQQSSTFTVILADNNLDPLISSDYSKWKLKYHLSDKIAYVGQNAEVKLKIRDIYVDNIYNSSLAAYSHKNEAGTSFMTKLTSNWSALFEGIQKRELLPLRIAAILKQDLKVFTDAQKYQGILLYLNFAAEERMAPVLDEFNAETPQKMKFISLSVIGVGRLSQEEIENGKEGEILVVEGEEKLTFSAFCPPDCPIYNNNEA